VAGHDLPDLRVGLPALAFDQQPEQAPEERAFDVGPLDPGRLGMIAVLTMTTSWAGSESTGSRNSASKSSNHPTASSSRTR
jgi:hypothetical protein